MTSLIEQEWQRIKAGLLPHVELGEPEVVPARWTGRFSDACRFAYKPSLLSEALTRLGYPLSGSVPSLEEALAEDLSFLAMRDKDTRLLFYPSDNLVTLSFWYQST